MLERALPSNSEEFRLPHRSTCGPAAATLYDESSLTYRDDGKPLKPAPARDTLHEMQLGVQAEMIASSSPVAGQPAMPMVPVPLDELLKIAGKFSEEGRFSEAECILDHVLSAAPDEPRALHQKGVLLFRMDPAARDADV